MRTRCCVAALASAWAYWSDVCTGTEREYFKQGKTREFLQILEEGSSSEIDEYYGDVKYERIAILNALAAYNTNCGKLETNKREKEEYFIRATHYYNKASKIDHHEPTTWVGKGHLLLAKGDLDQAYEVFKIALDGTPNNVPALLGQASVFFHKGKYFDSLKLYKSALEVNPSCPATVRLGIGLCHLMLKNKSKARQAFERVLQLDPENVEALVALGHLELNDDEAQNGMKPDAVREGMQKMMQAYEIYPFCTTALNYLGSHYFYAGQSYITEQLMEAALSSTDNSQMRAESFYNMARTFHAKGDYEKAASYYRASCQEVKNPKDFILPFYGLGQIHLKVGDFKAALTNFDKVLEARPDNPEALKVVGSIYMQTNREEMALVNFKKVTEIDPRDVDVVRRGSDTRHLAACRFPEAARIIYSQVSPGTSKARCPPESPVPSSKRNGGTIGTSGTKPTGPEYLPPAAVIPLVPQFDPVVLDQSPAVPGFS
ncbi:hypothetical protein CBR_g74629 [Chara braunii]|uniref:Uncharacterized protein n=1 Tax=Chara braunii TaxID=69332 RepID=A0A388KA49_CHABU|nr:hypothetical protein CBR_g74629 [Chara braunii]|eukprot:GBG66942.1 hypothetical protein CBR_g74629 [Chara braunii]